MEEKTKVQTISMEIGSEIHLLLLYAAVVM